MHRSDEGLILWQGKREKISSAGAGAVDDYDDDDDESDWGFNSQQKAEEEEEDQFDANFFALGSKFFTIYKS